MATTHQESPLTAHYDPAAPRAQPKAADPRIRTSDVYAISKLLPKRFDEPGKWKYAPTKQHPFYSTTNSDYGASKATVHEMPTGFFATTSKFTEHLNRAGPYRNFSLNR